MRISHPFAQSFTRTFVLSFALATWSLSASLWADDTEVFFSKAVPGETAAGNILFMFDTSGSMDDEDGTGVSRIDRLKQAMLDVLDSSANVRIGMGSFNGRFVGGAILVPPVGVDEDRCENASCDTIRVRTPVRSAADDGHETALGAMELGYDGLVMAQYEPSWTQTVVTATQSSGSDDAMEYADGTLDIDSYELALFGTIDTNKPAIGVRFTDVNIPPGAQVFSAKLTFATPWPVHTAGTQHARIRIDGTEDTPTFSDTAGSRVLDRGYLPQVVEWRDIDSRYNEDELVETTDLTQLVQARINMPDWEDNDAMSFVLEHSGDVPAGGGDRRDFKAYEAGFGFDAETRLTISYTTSTVPSQTVGMRFTNVNIPRGATIQSAAITFNAQSDSSSDAVLEISAQDIGNAPPFEDTGYNFTGRAKTTARVTWTPDRWDYPEWSTATNDIGPVIQELVSRPDWCGGNAMALMVTGNGYRSAEAYDKNPWGAPVLNINYSPGSVNFSDTCVRQTTQSSISAAVDDGFESLATGTVTTNSVSLNTHDGSGANTLGLRFQNVNIPQNATVVDAYVRLISGTGNSGTTNVTIRGENSAYSPVFNANLNQNLSSRATTTSSVLWADMESAPTGSGIKSPNIATIVQDIVGLAGWSPGNALTLLVQGDGSASGLRNFKSQEDDGIASLVVSYQLDETALGGTPVPLHTGRDDLVSAVLDMVPIGSTQLMDAYYEAASYMTGGPVEFGKQRGGGNLNERYYRVSAADTYTGGKYYRPPLCVDTNLSSEACVDERIDLDPVYDPNTPASCQTDQIVLLSDGQTTENSAEGLIQAMTGNASCASRANGNEQCGLELSDWLHTTDHFSAIDGAQPIVTHTVGFNFSSSFLEEVATAGGGGFYTANSSSDLVNVFSNIITTTADVNTSFVAPAATVSQTNRLANSNDLYFSLFHPQNSDKWDGNLKKYQLAKSTSDPDQTVIVGTDGNEAFDNATGAIKATAQSFWSTTSDGAEVVKGGAVSKLVLSRDLYTYTDTSTTPIALESFDENNTNITAALLNIDPTKTDYRTDLLKWSRGVDIKDVDDDGDTAEVRAQMGDPLHSVPAIVRFPDRELIFMGTNEGFLHAINTATGVEDFAFIPKTLLGNLDRFYNNAPSSERVYGLDGPITSWINDTNDNNIVDAGLGETAYVVVGMRRGGRDYYALNVTDPDNIELAWVITGGTGDFVELGQSWSRPIRSRVKSSGVEKDVLVFAAGYDEKNDDKVFRDKTDTMGRGFFIVDAHTGERLAFQSPVDESDLDYSIPSDLRVIDVNLDGFIDSIFVGDTGGQLWRFDIDNANTAGLYLGITGGVIADLGGDDTDDNRRFFNEPDVALISDSTEGEFLTIAIGSGFRANPLGVQVQDRFHVLRDPAVFGPPRNETNDITYTRLDDDDLFDATTESARTSNSDKLKKGWYLDLPNNGEKSMSKAITVNQQILFTTYLPESGNVGLCNVALGKGRVYALDALFGEAVINLDDSTTDAELTLTDRYRDLRSPGIPPSVTALIPEISPDSPVLLAGPEVLPTLDFGQLFKRTFWAAH